MTVSEIILPMQIMNDHYELSRDPPMTVLNAYLEMFLSNVKGILMKEILKRRCWKVKDSASGDPPMVS